jgi:hypothetical protein
VLIIAFDPGVTTGVAIKHGDGTISSNQLAGGLHFVWDFLTTLEPDVVVYEDFVYQRRDKVVLTSVEVIGVIKLWIERSGGSVSAYHHTAGTVMRFCSDDKLKTWGLYKSSQPHANDALRHLMYHLIVTRKEKEWLSLLKPDAPDTKPLLTPEK